MLDEVDKRDEDLSESSSYVSVSLVLAGRDPGSR